MRSKLLVALCLLLSIPAFAQQVSEEEEKKMMEAYLRATTPGDAHKALQPLVGTWDTVIRFWQAPGAPVQETRGVSDTRWILGDRYLEQRFTGEAGGFPFEGLGYTGYDNMRKQYFGTWMDNMSTGIMQTVGDAQPDGKTWLFKGNMDDVLVYAEFEPSHDQVVALLSRHSLTASRAPGGEEGTRPSGPVCGLRRHPGGHPGVGACHFAG